MANERTRVGRRRPGPPPKGALPDAISAGIRSTLGEHRVNLTLSERQYVGLERLLEVVRREMGVQQSRDGSWPKSPNIADLIRMATEAMLTDFDRRQRAESRSGTAKEPSDG